MHRAAATIFLAALGVWAPLVRAAPAPAVSASAVMPKKEQADAHYEQGKAYYRTGAYDLAIQEFLAGYEIDPRPGVLFNIGRAYEELKIRPKAVEYFKQYIDVAGPSAPAVTEARARVVALERQIQEDDERQKAEAAAVEQRQRDQAAAAAATSASSLGVDHGTGTSDGGLTVTAPPASPARARKLKIGGIAAAGAGVLLIGAGVYYVVHGNHLNDQIRTEITNTNTWTAALSAKDSDRRSANTLATVTLIGGGVALAGGAVLCLLGWRESERLAHNGAPTISWTPAAGPGWGSLVFIGRF